MYDALQHVYSTHIVGIGCRARRLLPLTYMEEDAVIITSACGFRHGNPGRELLQ